MRKFRWTPSYYVRHILPFVPPADPSLDDYSWLLRIEAENASRNLVTAIGSAALDGNGSCVFDGASQLQVPDSASWILGTSDFAYEWIVNPSSIPTDGRMVRQVVDASNELIIYYNGSGLLRAFATFGGSTICAISASTNPLSVGSFQHVALSRTGNEFNLSLGGVSVGTDTNAGSMGDIAALQGIGEQVNGSLSRTRFSRGTNRGYVSTGFTPPLRTDEIVVDEYDTLALDFAGTAASTRIIDLAKPDDGGVVGFCPDTSGNENDGTPTDVTYDASIPAYVGNGTSSVITLASEATTVRSSFFVTQGVNGSAVANLGPVFGDTIADDYTFIRSNEVDYSISMDGRLLAPGKASANGGTKVSGTNIDLGLSIAGKKEKLQWYSEYDAAISVARVMQMTAGGTYSLDGKLAGLYLKDDVPSDSDYTSITRAIASDYDVLGPMTFAELLAEATVIGRDVVITNTSTGNRQSAFVGGDDRNTNLVDTDLTNWIDTVDTGSGASFSVVNDNYTYRCNIVAEGYGAFKRFDLTLPKLGDYTMAFDIRLDSGSSQNLSLIFQEQSGGSWASKNLDISSEYTTIILTGISPDTDARILIGKSSAGAGTQCELSIENIRYTNTTEASEPFPDGTGAGYTKVDSITRGGVPLVFSGAGQTNLVSTVLTDWTNTLGTVTVTEPTPYEYHIDVNNPGTVSTLDYDIPSDSRDGTLRCQAKIISGTGVSTDFLAFTETNTVEGTSIRFDDLTSEWQDVTPTVTSADVTNRVRFRFSATSVIKIAVRYVSAYNFSASAPACVNGSKVGETFGTDLLKAAFPAYSVATICQIPVAYDWSDDENPVHTQYARFFAINEQFSVFVNNGDAALVANSTPNYSLPEIELTDAALTADEPSILFVDYNGTEVGMEFDDIARVTTPSTYVPSGDIALGNRLAWCCSHMAVATLVWPRILNSVERTVLKQLKTQIASGELFK